MSTPTGRRGGHVVRGEKRPDGRGKHTVTTAGPDQAGRLNRAAEQRGITRTELLNVIATWGSRRYASEVAAQDAVPAVHEKAPSVERAMTWIPVAGLLEVVDAHAEVVTGRSQQRNSVMRKHIARWLDEHAPQPPRSVVDSNGEGMYH